MRNETDRPTFILEPLPGISRAERKQFVHEAMRGPIVDKDSTYDAVEAAKKTLDETYRRVRVPTADRKAALEKFEITIFDGAVEQQVAASERVAQLSNGKLK